MDKRVIEIEVDEEDFKYCKEFCEKYKFDLGFENFCSYSLKLFAVLFRDMEKKIAINILIEKENIAKRI